MTLQIVKLHDNEMYRTHDTWAALSCVMDQTGGESPADHGWTIDPAEGDEKRMPEQAPFINFFCGFAAMAIVLPMPALADGTNGGESETQVSASVAGAAICDRIRCITNDGDIIEPFKISRAGGVEYVY